MTSLKEFDVVKLRNTQINAAEHIVGLYPDREYTITEVCSARDSVRIFLPEADEFRWLWSDRFVRVPQKEDFFYGFVEGLVTFEGGIVATAHLSTDHSLVMIDRVVTPKTLSTTIFYFSSGEPLFVPSNPPKIVSWANFVKGGS